MCEGNKERSSSNKRQRSLCKISFAQAGVHWSPSLSQMAGLLKSPWCSWTKIFRNNLHGLNARGGCINCIHQMLISIIFSFDLIEYSQHQVGGIMRATSGILIVSLLDPIITFISSEGENIKKHKQRFESHPVTSIIIILCTRDFIIQESEESFHQGRTDCFFRPPVLPHPMLAVCDVHWSEKTHW